MLSSIKENCPFEDAIISYMYDEMDGAERGKFETHLADCSVCTDEFAMISGARFEVFDWRKEEFSQLPTPNIVIPYEPKRGKNALVGLLAGFRGWLQPLPLAAAAGFVLVLGIGFMMMRSNVSTAPQIAANRSGVREPVLAMDAQPAAGSEIKQPVVSAAAPKTTVIEAQPVKAVTRRQTSNAKQTMARTVRKRSTSPASANAPVLSNYEAEDDTSLRLADLFANMDG